MSYNTLTTTLISGYLPGVEEALKNLPPTGDPNGSEEDWKRFEARAAAVEDLQHRFYRSAIRRGEWKDASCARLARKMGLVGMVEIVTTVHNLSKGGVMKETRRAIYV